MGGVNPYTYSLNLFLLDPNRPQKPNPPPLLPSSAYYFSRVILSLNKIYVVSIT